jgi:hypothetical protein
MRQHPLPVEYDRAERDGIVSLGCRAIECFRPRTFAAVGYPFAISSIAELWKYTECMHEGIGFNQPLDHYVLAHFLRGGFTAQEGEEIERIKGALDDLGQLIGRPCQYPTTSLFLALNQARHISALAPPGSTVVELGGGAGYLGALLVQRGYRYVATDVSQAFYLLQSHLLARVAPEGRMDLLDEALGPDDLRGLEGGQAAMVPWWRWVAREIPASLSIDLVTSNHNLLEMHERSRLYHLAVAREHLSRDSAGFVFEGWGDPSLTPPWVAIKAFHEKGFALAHNDARITCFVPAGSPHARDGVLTYPFPRSSRPGPSARSPAPGEARTFRTRLAAMLIGAGRRLGGRVLRDLVRREIESRLGSLAPASGPDPDAGAFAAPEFRTPRNPLSRAILAMREREPVDVSAGLADYRRLMGRADLLTEDDRFLEYVFRGTALDRPWTAGDVH